uniref:Deoxyribonuclease-2-alpha n=1 Tax=Sander lucioperca TaxID=283035 RepID=A0A8D0D862_SANLU
AGGAAAQFSPATDARARGLEYIYIDPKGKKTYKDHNKLINNTNGVLANTLKPLFKPTTSMVRIMFKLYSDQPPPDGKGVPDKFGHSKGLVMMDKTTGVWLSHSTPQFPFERDQNNFWPDSGATNAQTFICVTFKYNEFKKIGNVLTFTFDHQIPAGFHEELRQVTKKDLEKRPKRDASKVKTQDLTSAAGTTKFRSFAKKQYKVGDLYLTIAETYTAIKKINTDVRVQTWGQQSDGSYCELNQRQVIKIESVGQTAGLGGWPNTKDHSKWCVAKDDKNNLICIADVNRAYTQYERPGGALCFEHKEFKTNMGGQKYK